MNKEEKEFPLLMVQGKTGVISYKTILFALVFSGLILIAGVLVMIFTNIFLLGMIMTVFSATAFIIFVVLFPLTPRRKVYDELVEFTKAKDIDGIIGISKISSVYIKLVIFALLDLKEIEEAENIVDELDLNPVSTYRYVSSTGTNYFRALIKKTKQESEDASSGLINSKQTSKRKINKVFFFEKLPPGSKCMISSITLDVDKHNILACPNCEGMAKDELFIKWIEENKKCPKCKRKLTENDLVLVKLN